MFILELFQAEPEGYRDEKDDNDTYKSSNLRKTRLTLAQLNKLRIMNDVRKFETEKKLKQVTQQYAAPAPEAGM